MWHSDKIKVAMSTKQWIIPLVALATSYSQVHAATALSFANTDISALHVQKTISGTIKDAGTGQGISGVTISVKGTNIATQSDATGRYTIAANAGQSLIVSFIGYETQEVMVGDKTSLDLRLTASSTQMEEVVVTALGIMREKKSLGYSTTSVKGDDFTAARDPNLGNALSGKVAGVSVAGNSTGLGGSSRVVIRGAASMTGNNMPLYVVDGIPLTNSNQGSAGQYGGMDMGDGLNSINADDIENIQVLKGAAASALYGYRGGNGVIMITTKSGKGSQGIGVDLNNNMTVNTIYDFRDFQDTYGQGRQGIKPAAIGAANDTYNQSWGAKMDGSQAVNKFGNNYAYSPIDNWKNFYRTGLSNQTSVAVSGSDEKSTFRLGLNNMYEGSILPNAKSNQRGANLNTTYKITPKVQLGINANYMFEFVNNRANLSDGNGNTNASLLYLANTYDVRWLEAEVDEFGKELQPGNNVYFNNPYFLQNRKSNKSTKKRLTGGFNLRYDITDWLYAQGAVTRDGFNLAFKQVQPKGASADPNGYINEYNNEFEETNFNYLIGAKKKLGDFSISATVGGNHQKTRSETWGTDGGIRPFILDGFYSTGNVAAGTRTFKKLYDEYLVKSFYGTADFAYKDFLFLNLSARNDWFSTLDPENNGYLYPSASLSYVFTDHLKLPEWINMGKLRLSRAASSNGTSAYRTALAYQMQSFEIQGQPIGTIKNSTVPNANLKPVRIAEWEAGANLEFWGNRMGLDLAVYQKTTTDDLVQVTTSTGSGYSSAMQNIGELRNKGIEVLLYGDVIRATDFKWKSSINFAFNDSEVLSLGAQNNLIFEGGLSRSGNASVQNVVGLAYGQIVGYKYKTDVSGNRIFDDKGLPVRSDAVEVLGSGVHRFTGGFRNDFTYKNFSLGMLLDVKLGGKIFSGTNLNLYGSGLHKATLEGREGKIVGKGVNLSGTANTTAVDAETYWKYVVDQSFTEEFVYDAGFVKLREISFGYRLPSSFLSKTPFRSASLSLVGRNLWTIHKNTPNIDPESAYNTSNAQGLELNGYPMTRNVGFNLNLKF
ncbi:MULTISPECIES: SusC/RagA family TonB-linked outer membrane protein [Sphingobacterium]|uniref:SusC/RagA family TonB-linked outer membrane protein n=1 Tax=Sphingobacterium TaxID=28453 RepID=UPI0010D79807|nr:MULTISPECIES: SusC/RagA family TonB-linked outer membrane protein [Sphingobacterium]MCW2263151.1 TonB-linked SusC/RagA family outer membrane protein [Sphingobacterium kitahiroshimense]TCR11866.1 TonB-linked SusC/RagA family outer membrane protein [Sphingobacterium sp. JUb78]